MGLEITAKIFILLPEGQLRKCTRSFYKKLWTEPLRIEKYMGVFGLGIFGNRLCD
jgi:hypothetical protein